MTLKEEVKIGQVSAHVRYLAAYSRGLSQAAKRDSVEQITVFIIRVRVVTGEDDHLRDTEER